MYLVPHQVRGDEDQNHHLSVADNSWNHTRLHEHKDLLVKIAIIVGTRPEIIKMASVIRECQNREISFFIIHSNQHYSQEMDSIFFDELDLPKPHYNLGVGSGLHGNQTGNLLIKMEPVLVEEKPDVTYADIGGCKDQLNKLAMSRRSLLKMVAASGISSTLIRTSPLVAGMLFSRHADAQESGLPNKTISIFKN